MGEDRIAAVRPQRHLGHQVLHLIAGQRQLGEDKQVDALLARLRGIIQVDAEVVRYIAQFGVDLRQTDIDAHGRCSFAGCQASS